jgi:hypothetical protein
MKHSTREVAGPRRSTVGRLGGLIALNGVLLVLLGVVTLGRSADAQPMSRGEYTMIAGRAQGAAAGIVYVVDTANLELIALTYDPNSKDLEGIGYRNLAADARTLLNPGSSR